MYIILGTSSMWNHQSINRTTLRIRIEHPEIKPTSAHHDSFPKPQFFTTRATCLHRNCFSALAAHAASPPNWRYRWTETCSGENSKMWKRNTHFPFGICIRGLSDNGFWRVSDFILDGLIWRNVVWQLLRNLGFVKCGGHECFVFGVGRGEQDTFEE